MESVAVDAYRRKKSMGQTENIFRKPIRLDALEDKWAKQFGQAEKKGYLGHKESF